MAEGLKATASFVAGDILCPQIHHQALAVSSVHQFCFPSLLTVVSFPLSFFTWLACKLAVRLRTLTLDSHGSALDFLGPMGPCMLGPV